MIQNLNWHIFQIFYFNGMIAFVKLLINSVSNQYLELDVMNATLLFTIKGEASYIV